MYSYYYRRSDMGTNGYSCCEKKKKGIQRFIEAQSKEYKIAHQEIFEGKKKSHWIWYIYPQITGLGMSFMDREYSIKSIEEAFEYINDDLLKKRLYEMTKLLLNIKHNDIKEVMWYPDDLKLRSCMTLFLAVSGDKIFEKVIDKFYEGEKDLKTINILNKMYVKEKENLDKKFCIDFEKRIKKIEKEEKIKLENKIKLEKEEEMKLKKEKEQKLKIEEEIKLKKIKESELKKLKEKETLNRTTNEKLNNLAESKNKIDNKAPLYNQDDMDIDENSISSRNIKKTNEEFKNKTQTQNDNIKK